MDINRRRRQKGEPCNFLRPLIRVWGITTAIVCCGVGVDIHLHGYTFGIFILFGSIVIFFFELKWIITLFVQLLFASDNYSGCLLCWTKTSKVSGSWTPSPLYVAFGTALIIWPHNLWLSYVGGALLIVLGVLRLLTLCRFSGSTKGEEGLLPQREDYFDKPGLFKDRINDSFANVCHHSLEDEEPIDDDDS